MRKQVRGLSRGMDGISLCQVMDGALGEVTAMVQRVSELSIQSANGTNLASDREDFLCEVEEILKKINHIGDTTKFNKFCSGGAVNACSGKPVNIGCSLIIAIIVKNFQSEQRNLLRFLCLPKEWYVNKNMLTATL